MRKEDYIKAVAEGKIGHIDPDDLPDDDEEHISIPEEVLNWPEVNLPDE